MKIYLSRTQAVSAIFLILCAMNLPLIVTRYQANNSILDLNIEVTAAILILFLLVLASCNRRLFKITSSLFILLNSVCLYYIVHYKTGITAEIVNATFNTSAYEIQELFNYDLSIWITVSVLFLIAFNSCVIITSRQSKRRLYPQVILTACIAYMCVSAYFLTVGTQISRRLTWAGVNFYLPFNYMTHACMYAEHKYKQMSQDQNIYCDSTGQIKRNQDLNIVLVVGESARADRFSLNGYHRNTSPLLGATKNIVSFTNMSSLGTGTQETVPRIFEDYGAKKLCLIPMLKKLGFYTKWATINSSSGDIMPAQSSSDEIIARTQVLSGSSTNFDDSLIKFLQPKAGKRLDVLHTMGSHENYVNRVPQDFKKFTPECSDYTGNCAKEMELWNNSYDNTILYTDYFLHEVIKRMQNHNALVIYVSDHGEAMGENGLFIHGHSMATAPKGETHIPMIWWASDKFLADPENRKRFAILKSNMHKRLDQSHVFYSILDCIGVESSAIDKTKSICSRSLS